MPNCVRVSKSLTFSGFTANFTAPIIICRQTFLTSCMLLKIAALPPTDFIRTYATLAAISKAHTIRVAAGIVPSVRASQSADGSMRASTNSCRCPITMRFSLCLAKRSVIKKRHQSLSEQFMRQGENGKCVLQRLAASDKLSGGLKNRNIP